MLAKLVLLIIVEAVALFAWTGIGIAVAPLAGHIEGGAAGWGQAMMWAWLALTFVTVVTPLFVAEKAGWLSLPR